MSATPDEELSTFRDARRRRNLVVAGATMLALGVALNLPRLLDEEPPSVDAMTRPDPFEEEIISDDGQEHAGEEGKMGRPGSKNKSGLYAMKGPKSSIPQMARSNAKREVWGGPTGTEVGEAYGANGLALVGTGSGGGGTGEGTIGLGNTGLIGKGGGGGTGTGYGHGAGQGFGPRGHRFVPQGTFALPPALEVHRGFVKVADDARSTFSIDVDTASYASVRSSLVRHQLPEPEGVRVEEMINYFDYDYAAPEGDAPFSVTAEVAACPWNPEHQLVHLGLQGKTIAADAIPPRNLVFLVDASGSMRAADKLPLVKESLSRLTKTLRAEDRISLVVYAGAAGVVLPPTSGAEQDEILDAIERLSSGGSTNGAAGIEEAYALARGAFIRGGVNRVILATDGDFNVGVASHHDLLRLIENKRRSGVELSVLGYGMGHRDHTMEQLADKGNGNYAYIDGIAEAHKVLVEEAGGTLVTIAKDVKIQVQLDPDRVESYRLIGYDNRRLAHEDFADDTKDAGEIGAGHTVTALYEVVPRGDASEPGRWMTVDLRYKPPQGDTSRHLSLPIDAAAQPLDEASDDFRFSAAVASFGMLLRDRQAQSDAAESGEAEPAGPSWTGTHALAREALGDDESCRRHELLQLVERAARLDGHYELSHYTVRCEIAGERGVDEAPPAAQTEPAPPPEPDLLAPTNEPPPPRATGGDDAPPEDEPGWGAMFLEVLRLLPPLLAFPLFVMAYRRPRRRTPPG